MKDSTDIPDDVLPRMAKVVTRCRIGKGVSYRDGVSPAGSPLYDRFLRMLNDDGVVYVIRSLFHTDIYPKLYIRICQAHLRSIMGHLRGITISDRLKDVIDYLLADIESAHSAPKRKDFRELTAPFIDW